MTIDYVCSSLFLDLGFEFFCLFHLVVFQPFDDIDQGRWSSLIVYFVIPGVPIVFLWSVCLVRLNLRTIFFYVFVMPAVAAVLWACQLLVVEQRASRQYVYVLRRFIGEHYWLLNCYRDYAFWC